MQANKNLPSRVKAQISATLLAANELTRFQLAVIATLLVLIAAGSVIAYVRSRPRAIEVKQIGGDKRQPSLSVHVAGAVARPGLYLLSEGSRVADALEKAGGAATDALIDGLNLAARLKDGEKVMVPRRQETPPEAAGVLQAGAATDTTSTGDRPVNINTAGVSELETLPGIGPEYARRIVEYRVKNGPFSSVDELDEVMGIGPHKLDSLKGLVNI